MAFFSPYLLIWWFIVLIVTAALFMVKRDGTVESLEKIKLLRVLLMQTTLPGYYAMLADNLLSSGTGDRFHPRFSCGVLNMGYDHCRC